MKKAQYSRKETYLLIILIITYCSYFVLFVHLFIYLFCLVKAKKFNFPFHFLNKINQ